MKPNDQNILKIEDHIEGIIKEWKVSELDDTLMVFITGLCVRDEILSDLSSDSKSQISGILLPNQDWSRYRKENKSRERDLQAMVNYFLKEVGIVPSMEVEHKIEIIEEQFDTLWSQLTANHDADLIDYLSIRHLCKILKDTLFGYGPLEDLIRMPTISEIMVVGSDKIYVEKSGLLQNSGRRFLSDEVTETVIQRIVSRINRHINKATPLVDARLVDGSRVNAVIEPLVLSGPCLTIRKFPESRIQIDDLIRWKSMTPAAAEFLRASVLNRRNILISGGTGSGKTTFLNCLSDFIPDNERIITIEDTAELRLFKEHVVRMESREANAENKGEYTIRDLVRNALRMRPDRIIVGECRGKESLDMLQAMNTGHDGSMTTIHANTSHDVVLRLEVLVQMASDLPVESIHRQIVSAIDLIVQLSRMKDGRRCVTQISEVFDINPITKKIMIRDIFSLDRNHDHSILAPTGALPSFMDVLLERELIQLDQFYL